MDYYLQIIGLGSVLDQNAQQVETSSTALSGLIMKIYQQPAKFAKIAGLDVKEFSEVMRKDANEALLTLLDTLGKKGGLAELAPVFKDMNLNGARSSSILSVLAGNIQKIREEQKTATDAFREGTSVINEYNIQNNTFEAKMEKQKKVFLSYITDIGEKLAPMVLEGVSAGALLLKVFSSIISILVDNKKAIITLATALVTYNVVMNASIALKKISFLWNQRLIVQEKLYAVGAQLSALATYSKGLAHDVLRRKITLSYAANEALRLSFAKTPWGLVITLMTTAAVGIWQFAKNTKQAVTQTNLLNDSTKEANRSIASQKAELNLLLSVAKNEHISKEERMRAIKRLNEISPEYLGNLNLENIKTKAITESVEAYTTALLNNAKAKAIENKVTEEESKKTDNLLKIEQLKIKQKNAEDAAKTPNAGSSAAARASQSIKDEIKSLQVVNEAIDKNIAIYTGFYEKTYDKPTFLDKTIPILQSEVNAENKKLSNLKQEQAILMGNGPKVLKPNEESDYVTRQKLININREIDSQQKLVNVRKEALDLAVKESEKVIEAPPEDNGDKDKGGKGDKSSAQRKKVTDGLREVEEQHLKNMAAIKEQHLKGEIETEEDFNLKILAQQDKYDADRKTKLESFLKSITDPSLRIDIAKQIADIDERSMDRAVSNMQKRKKDIAKWNDEETKKVIDSSLQYLDSEEEKENQLLNIKHAKRLISDQEYQDEQLKIELKYLDERLKINGLTEDEIAKLKKHKTVSTGKQEENKADARTKALDQYGLVSFKSQREAELATLKYYEEQGIITHDEALKVKAQLDQAYLDNVTAKMSEASEKVQVVGGDLTGAMSNFASAEENAVSRKYDKQIAAAEGNAKKQKKLEAEKQKELNDIKAKYADKQFAVQTAMTISSTAVAAMEAYKAMAGIPIVGPALGAIAAGAAIVYGVSQIKVAKEQRDAAKEGYFDGGFTGGTNPKQVRGYLPGGEPIHGREFVANRHSTASNLLRPLWNVVDDAQNHNTVGSLTRSDLARALKIPMPGYSQGGFAESPSPVAQHDTQSTRVYDKLFDTVEKLNERLNKQITAKVFIKGDDGLEDTTNLYERIKNNASRT